MALLTRDEIAQALSGMPGWALADGEIVREYSLEGGFVGSVAFVNRLTEVAEEMNHHPDLSISWNRVTVRLSTHSEGGVTDKDLTLARAADALAQA